MKKKTKRNLISQSNITLIFSITSLLISVVILIWISAFWSTYQWQSSTFADEIYELTKTNAMQDYCIEHSIKPCTHETINKTAEESN